MNALATLDALGQAELVRRREVSPSELVEAAIGRIERLNPQLGAVVATLYDEGRRDAAGELPSGPFTGVPFLLKDLGAAYAGTPTGSGSKLLRQIPMPSDSEVVVRYKRAGLVIIGKTNTPEFGILPTTESAAFGPCRNPWNLANTAGGSSGGAAAAVAAGLVPAAHASDGGGSIRIPAACCGVFGLKPTRARTPLGPAVGDIMSGLGSVHAISRSVRDSAALLDATAGPDIGDPYWAPPPPGPFLAEVGADPGRLRIAFTTKALTAAAVHPACQAAVHDVAALLTGLGHHVSEAAPAIDGEALAQAFIAVWAAGVAWSLDGLRPILGRAPAAGDVEPLTWGLYEEGRRQKAPDYLTAVTVLQRLSRTIGQFFTEYDVWLTPTLAEPPVPLGTFASTAENPLQGLWRATAFTPFTPIANVTGQPAMSVPLVWDDTGLPIGTQFFGRFGDEATLLRLAAQLEAARPWHRRWPAVAEAVR